MSDRRTGQNKKDSGEEYVGEAVVGIRADVNTIKQLTSSSEAAKAHRMASAVAALEKAAQAAMGDSKSGGNQKNN
ncbi:hypothetical protein Aspvir_003447 [Aspergillus viridinutans]|uniref:Uncharacterized protein n=1 Tax=Aspergillus viridinutans TaxID=75553 RepID=A0A9P3CCR4_ASPVI|nr:uncharacterized protein Aspvir_003447 [Aspergillus viridinutans]GIK07779.1 hypothetical protein Aspvir_003447 [Aspergillus viridinutans]